MRPAIAHIIPNKTVGPIIIPTLSGQSSFCILLISNLVCWLLDYFN
jgi:hypothetical protein